MAKDTYRAAVLYDALDLRIESLPSITISADQVAIQPLFCGICGSDLHFYFEAAYAATLKTPHPLTGAKLPITMGHEFAGRILEVGSDCKDLAIGDLVTVMPVISDGTCLACQQGGNNACAQLGFIGLNGIAGGLSDRAVVPYNLVFKLPSTITPEIGALVEPLSVGWHAVGLLGGTLKPDSAVLVLGSGPVGCVTLMSLLAQGIRNVVVSEPSDPRRNLAITLGAKAVHNPLDPQDDTLSKAAEEGYEAVFDCAGAKNTLNVAVQHVRSLGTIVNVALRTNNTEMPLYSMIHKEIVLRSSVAYTAKDYRAVIDAIADGRLNPKAIITKCIPLDKIVKEGFEDLTAKNNRDCKILVDLSI